MKGDFYINVELAPKGWPEFEAWHKKAAPGDPLSARERFKKLGGKIPRQKNDNKRINKKSK